MAQVKSLRTGIKFKDTPAGKIPVDWDVRKVENIGEIVTGSTPSTKIKEYFGNKFMFVTPTDIGGFNYVKKTERKLSDKGMEVSRKIPKDSVMVVCIASIGKLAIASEDCATNQQINSIICNETTDPHFIYYLICSKVSELLSLAGKTAVPIINKSLFSKLLIQLPHLEEQKKIAEILTTVDDAIEETDRIIQKTKELKKGLMQQLLIRGIGHKKFKKTEIGEIPVEWEVGRLGDLCEGKPEYGANVSALDRDDNLPRYVRITDVTDDGYLQDDTLQSIDRKAAEPYILKEGDFLFARSGATVGKTYLYHEEDGECAFAGYMIRFRPDRLRLLPEFLFQFTHADSYYNWVKGMFRAGAQPNINGTEYAGLIIPKPPINEQKKIVNILSSMDEEIRNETNHKQNLETLKKSLMQVLLTGRVRVKLH